MPFITGAMHGRKAVTPCRLKLNNHPMGVCSGQSSLKLSGLYMLRDQPMQCATCAKWAHDTERCCMVCELHHSGVLQGRLQAVQQCVCCAD